MKNFSAEQIQDILKILGSGNQFKAIKYIMDHSDLDLKKANKLAVTISKRMRLSFVDLTSEEVKKIDNLIFNNESEKGIDLIKEYMFLGHEDATIAFYSRSEQLGITKEL